MQQELIPSIHKYCRAAKAPGDSTLRTSGHRFTKEVESPDDQMHIDDCLVLRHILRPSHFLTVFLQNISFDTVYRRETWIRSNYIEKVGNVHFMRLKDCH